MEKHSPSEAPLVWQDLDQTALDRAYDQANWARNIPEVLGRYTTRSQEMRRQYGQPMRMSYGPGPQEQLDFFSCGGHAAPLLVFVHGGAWRSGAAQDYAFVAAPFLQAGLHVAVLDFNAVQDCGGELLEMVRQVRMAVNWLLGQAAQLQVNAHELHLAGHSSGAHLAAAVTTGDGQDWSPLPLASLTCISGLYELEPVRRSSRSSYIAFTDAGVERLSPARHARDLRCPTLVVHGSLESPQFQWQAQAWTQALSEAHVPVQTHLGVGLNHFEILDTLGDSQALLTKAMLAHIKR